MVANRGVHALLGVVFALALSGCVTLPPNAPRSKQDPWESWNRGVYRVNTALDNAVTKPIAKGYVKVVPSPLRTGVSNFFANLNTTDVMINDALQGKFKAAANDLGRFLLNSTVGLGGLLDPATPAGLDRNDGDFGETLGKWGVHAGPFLELPLLGPSDFRDGPAKLVDAYMRPQGYIKNTTVKYSLWGFDLLDKRASLLSLDETLKRVYDPYAFIRDAYLQHRAYLVSDGKSGDETPLEDPGEDAPAPKSITPPPAGPTPAPTPTN
jgi:phospholipid-binding lipoprotein MlaA